MKPYPDTNFFTRSYLDLPGSEIAESIFEQALQRGAVPMPITWLHRLEIANALERPCLRIAKREVSTAFHPSPLRQLMRNSKRICAKA